LKPFGTRSLSLILLFAIVLGFAFRIGLFRAGTLEGITPDVAVCLGIFTILVGTWLFRIWDLGSPSRSYLRLDVSSKGTPLRVWEGEQVVLRARRIALVSGMSGHEPPRELPRLVRRLGAQAVCLLVGLVCFNSRTVPLMFDTPRRLANAGAQFCPPPEGSEEKPKPPEKPGCELVFRAFKLGYVKSLGSCAPDEKEKKLELCYLRQVDEPYLHWSARLFMAFVEKVKGVVGGPDFLKRQQASFETQLKHRQTLIGQRRSVVGNAPKSSHHIFTNLPYPNGKLADIWESWFRPNECFTRYRKLSHTTDPGAPDAGAQSRVLDHIYGHLLFDSKYDEAIGDCKEYHIHWNQPSDACGQLAKNPEKFLGEHGALDSVRGVLDRLKQKEDLTRLDVEMSTARGDLVGPRLSLKAKHEESGVLKPRAVVEADTVVSFQCFMRGEPASSAPKAETAASVGPPRPSPQSVTTVSFNLLGTRFSASESSFPAEAGSRRVNVDLYKELSAALADGFTYTGYMSRSGSAAATGAQIGPEAFASSGSWDDFSFSRLESLKSADVFLGNDWLQSRDDLLEVYPYYHHLYHFVQLFRQKYRLQRTHL
jgi:hypothetical protein